MLADNSAARQWVRAQGDSSDCGPLIILDECHKAKNLLSDTGLPTLVGFAVMHLQKLLPGACVLYSSATGISEPRNMAYMTRLGSCGYDSMAKLINCLITAGLGASELFSCSLKASGVYLGRCLPARIASSRAAARHSSARPWGLVPAGGLSPI